MVVVNITIYTLVCATLILAVLILDRDEPEPPMLLGGAFLWGAIPSTLIAWNTLELVTNLLTVAVVEEGLKGFLLALYLICHSHEVCNRRDIFIYSTFIGMGFAYGEGVYYLMLQVHTWGVFFYVLLHVGWLLSTGMGLLYGHHIGNVGPGLVGAGVAVMAHALYNYWVAYNPPLAVLSYLVSLVFIGGGYLYLIGGKY